MGELLNELLNEIDKSFDETVRHICNAIMDDELDELNKYDNIPNNSNTFLILPINQHKFLSLEIEFPQNYIIRLLEFNLRTKSFFTSKVINVNENTPEKIIKFYVKLYDHYMK